MSVKRDKVLSFLDSLEFVEVDPRLGDPVNKKSVEMAREFVHAMNGVHLQGLFGTFTPSGNIQLEWELEGRYFEIEFYDGKYHYYYEMRNTDHEGILGDLEVALDLLNAIMGD